MYSASISLKEALFSSIQLILQKNSLHSSNFHFREHHFVILFPHLNLAYYCTGILSEGNYLEDFLLIPCHNELRHVLKHYFKDIKSCLNVNDRSGSLEGSIFQVISIASFLSHLFSTATTPL